MIPRPGSQVGNLCVAGSISAATLLNPKVFFWLSVSTKLAKYFAKYLKNIFGNPSQSQSLFLTFSFHQTCKMLCKIFEKHFWQPFSIPKVFFWLSVSTTTCKIFCKLLKAINQAGLQLFIRSSIAASCSTRALKQRSSLSKMNIQVSVNWNVFKFYEWWWVGKEN